MESVTPSTLKITVVENGFIVEGSGEELPQVFEESERDELHAIEALLWHVLNTLGPSGRDFTPEEITIVRRVGSEYTPIPGEILVKRDKVERVTRSRSRRNRAALGKRKAATPKNHKKRRPQQ